MISPDDARIVIQRARRSANRARRMRLRAAAAVASARRSRAAAPPGQIPWPAPAATGSYPCREPGGQPD